MNDLVSFYHSDDIHDRSVLSLLLKHDTFQGKLLSYADWTEIKRILAIINTFAFEFRGIFVREWTF